MAVSDADRLRAVMVDVYEALELRMDPGTVGGVADEVGGVGVDEVERAVLAAYDGVVAAPLDGVSLALAAELEPQHRL